MLADLTEKRFKSQSTMGELIIKERDRLKKIEKITIEEYRKNNNK